MTRPLRIEFSGAWYHVMNRSTGRRVIFRTLDHHHYFLNLLSDVTERFQAEVHAYCLMSNHYHLMLRTPRGNLQRIMRHVNGLYTQYWNRSLKTDGPLFRGRYKAILVDADAYWLHLSRYIHRNPLEAGMTPRLDRYRWSSYGAYIGKVKKPAWLYIDYVLSAISQRNKKSGYKAFVQGATDNALEKFYAQKKLPPILGDESFKRHILRGRHKNIDQPELNQATPCPTIDRIAEVVTTYYEIKPEMIWRSTRGKGVTTPARSVAMYLCQRVGEMRLAEIAKQFGLSHYASAGATIRVLKQRLNDDKQLKKDINTILLDLIP